jgi:DNA polymerase I
MHDLILIDGSSYLYRAFHALPPFTTSRGEPTGAVLGVTNMLLKFLREYPAKHTVVVFDAPGKTFRDELFAEYKSHRPPMPDELRSQITPLLEIVRAMGLPLLRIEGVEADDVIGTLAMQAVARGEQVLISTGDKDMCQLVSDQVRLINTMSGSQYDRAAVKEKFDVWPEQIIDYLALVGDTADNIPGIPKVGPKTAAKWLNAYGNIDTLVANAAEIPGKVGENLREGLDTLALSRQLATIRCDLDLTESVTDLAAKPADTATLKEWYERLEFRALLRGLQDPSSLEKREDNDSPQQSQPPTQGLFATTEILSAPRRYSVILDQDLFDQWLASLREAPLFAFDTETTSLDYMQAQIVGLSFCIEPGEAAYLPLAHHYVGAPKQLDRAQVLATLKPLLESDAYAKVGHHLKYDAHVLANHGITLRGMRFDTMLESYVWNSVATRHDMDSVSERYLGIKPIAYVDVAGKGAKQINFSEVDLDRAAEYAAEDADITLRLHRTLWPAIERESLLQTLYRNFEQPLVPVLLGMERHGVLIDKEMLLAQSAQLAIRARELEAAAHQAAGGEFNLDSPKQLQAILFERMGIPVLRKTPKGQPSTAEDVLEELAETHELPRLILDYRSIAKLRSTYTEKLPSQINPVTGRVHTSYHQAVAQTGRLSSTDPNLQNIPIRTPEGRRIRQAFIAPPGHRLLAADYSQIELRIMAHLSGDRGLCDAFAQDRDVHQATAAEVFDTPIDQVTADQRRSAKAINFGLIYGMSAFGLARQLGIDRSAAQRYVELYFARYPGVKDYMDRTRRLAKENGFVETVFGRRLYLPDINSRNRALQQYAERSAINAPMQGTAADLIKLAMIAVDEWCRTESGQSAKLIMQVHDELVLEVTEEAVDRVREAVRQRMVEAAGTALSVPLKVDVGVGQNWDEAH